MTRCAAAYWESAASRMRSISASCSSLIFRAERGNERLLDARHWFEHSIQLSGIKDFTWHCLRHTFASRLVMSGVDLATVRDLMGHRTIAMTLKYAHLSPAHTTAAIEKLVERNRQEKAAPAAILVTPDAGRTDTSTDTEQKQAIQMVTRNVQ